jgi:hypothetical protein
MIDVYLSPDPGYTTRLVNIYLDDPAGVNTINLPLYKSEAEALAAGALLNSLFVDYSGQTKLVMQRTSFIMNFSARNSLLRRVF